MLKWFIFTPLLCCALAAHWCCDPPKDRQAILDLILKDNNHDGDAYVSTADFHYDLNNNYDTNPKDGKISVYEWVKRWNCRYGDSYEFATWVFKQINGGKDFVDITAFHGPADPGIPLAAFRATNEKAYHCHCTGPVSNSIFARLSSANGHMTREIIRYCHCGNQQQKRKSMPRCRTSPAFPDCGWRRLQTGS